jgi:hypothetical protein
VIQNPMTVDELRRMPPAVPIGMACRALGIGLTKGYDLAKKGEFPVPLKPVGNAKYRAQRSAILAYLGVSETAPAQATAA